MKTRLWLICALLTCLLAGCATFQGSNGREYDQDVARWRLVAKQRMMVRAQESPGMSYKELQAGDSLVMETPRRDEIHFLVKIWEPHGWSAGEQTITVERGGRWSGIQRVLLDDYLINNAPRLSGYFINSFGETIINVTYRGHKIARLGPGEYSRDILTPGKLYITWQTRPNGPIYDWATTILDNHKKVEFNDEMVDWTFYLTRW